MKKIIVIAMALCLAIPNAVVFAEETTVPQAIPTRQNIIRERLERQRQNYLQNLEEARSVAKEYRQTTDPVERRELRDKARMGFMVRLTNAAQKMSEMQDKVEARLDLAEEKGFDVSAAREQLELSREHLGIVLEEQENLKEAFTNDDTEDDVTKEEAQTIFATIKENFGLARKALIASIQSLKETVTESENDEDANTEDEDEEETTPVEDENEEETTN